MADIIYFDELKKQFENRLKNDSAYQFFLSEKNKKFILENIIVATKKFNTKDDFGALLALNEAIYHCYDNNIIPNSMIDTALLGMIYFNSGNYKQALVHLYRSLALFSDNKVIIMVILAAYYHGVNDEVLSTYFKNMAISNTDVPLIQLAKTTKNISSFKTLGVQRARDIDYLKRAFANSAKAGEYDNARYILQTLWDLDRSDVYINYWYLNYGEDVNVQDYSIIPYFAIVQRQQKIAKCFIDCDKNFIDSLLTGRDSDSLVNFLVEFFPTLLSVSFIKHFLTFNNAKFQFDVEKVLFSDIKDGLKLKIFMCVLETNVNKENKFAFRYRNRIVAVVDFGYEKTTQLLNDKLSKSCLQAIEYLIKNEETFINAGAMIEEFLGVIYGAFVEENLVTIKNMAKALICVYYVQHSINIPNYLEDFYNNHIVNLYFDLSKKKL